MASKITPRTASVASFGTNLGEVAALAIKDGAIEARHIDEGEIMSKHLTSGISSVISIPFIIEYAVTADATGGLTIISSLPHGIKIIDAWAECTTANASGTLTVNDGTTAITSAIVCAVDKVVSRTASLDDAKSTLATGGTLKVVANGASDRGVVRLLCIKTAG